jgi:hypothetical protein
VTTMSSLGTPKIRRPPASGLRVPEALLDHALVGSTYWLLPSGNDAVAVIDLRKAEEVN